MSANKNSLTKLEKSWILYDVGNSAYTMISCSLIPIWFKAISIGDPAQGYLTGDEATAWYSTIVMIVTIITALLGPFLGTIADGKSLRKPIFTTALAIGVIGCILNAFTTGWVLFILVYMITRISYQASQCAYDAMLVDITSEERMDVVSSYGYAWGYIGSCIPFLIALLAYILGDKDMGFMLISPSLAKIIGLSATAIWWLIVTVPLLKNYKQVHYSNVSIKSVHEVFSRLIGTCSTIIKKDKKVGLFLLAYFLYIDGVGTIIDNAINIGTDLGLHTVGQVVFLLATQVVAWIFSMLFAWLSKRFSASTLIQICIAGYFLVCVYVFFLSALYQFAIMAFMVGMFQGSIQSLSRSYYAKIIPANHSGEYFGIYDVFCKGASFIGSAVIAIVKFSGGTINIAVSLLTFLFFFGFIFFRMSEKTPATNY